MWFRKSNPQKGTEEEVDVDAGKEVKVEKTEEGKEEDTKAEVNAEVNAEAEAEAEAEAAADYDKKEEWGKQEDAKNNPEVAAKKIKKKKGEGGGEGNESGNEDEKEEGGDNGNGDSNLSDRIEEILNNLSSDEEEGEVLEDEIPYERVQENNEQCREVILLNFYADMSDEKLNSLLNIFGKVKNVYIDVNESIHVEFFSLKSARKAKEHLDSIKIKNRRIQVIYGKSKEDEFVYPAEDQVENEGDDDLHREDSNEVPHESNIDPSFSPHGNSKNDIGQKTPVKLYKNKRYYMGNSQNFQHSSNSSHSLYRNHHKGDHPMSRSFFVGSAPPPGNVQSDFLLSPDVVITPPTHSLNKSVSSIITSSNNNKRNRFDTSHNFEKPPPYNKKSYVQPPPPPPPMVTPTTGIKTYSTFNEGGRKKKVDSYPHFSKHQMGSEQSIPNMSAPPLIHQQGSNINEKFNSSFGSSKHNNFDTHHNKSYISYVNKIHNTNKTLYPKSTFPQPPHVRMVNHGSNTTYSTVKNSSVINPRKKGDTSTMIPTSTHSNSFYTVNSSRVGVHGFGTTSGKTSRGIIGGKVPVGGYPNRVLLSKGIKKTPHARQVSHIKRTGHVHINVEEEKPSEEDNEPHIFNEQNPFGINAENIMDNNPIWLRRKEKNVLTWDMNASLEKNHLDYVNSCVDGKIYNRYLLVTNIPNDLDEDKKLKSYVNELFSVEKKYSLCVEVNIFTIEKNDEEKLFKYAFKKWKINEIANSDSAEVDAGIDTGINTGVTTGVDMDVIGEVNSEMQGILDHAAENSQGRGEGSQREEEHLGEVNNHQNNRVRENTDAEKEKEEVPSDEEPTQEEGKGIVAMGSKKRNARRVGAQRYRKKEGDVEEVNRAGSAEEVSGAGGAEEVSGAGGAEESNRASNTDKVNTVCNEEEAKRASNVEEMNETGDNTDDVGYTGAKRCAHLTFRTIKNCVEAKKALEEKKFKVTFSAPSKANNCLWVGNILKSYFHNTSGILKIMFSHFGEVVNLKYVTDKNCLFLQYDNIDSAIKARNHMYGIQISKNTLLNVDFSTLGEWEGKQKVSLFRKKLLDALTDDNRYIHDKLERKFNNKSAGFIDSNVMHLLKKNSRKKIYPTTMYEEHSHGNFVNRDNTGNNTLADKKNRRSTTKSFRSIHEGDRYNNNRIHDQKDGRKGMSKRKGFDTGHSNNQRVHKKRRDESGEIENNGHINENVVTNAQVDTVNNGAGRDVIVSGTEDAETSGTKKTIAFYVNQKYKCDFSANFYEGNPDLDIYTELNVETKSDIKNLKQIKGTCSDYSIWQLGPTPRQKKKFYHICDHFSKKKNIPVIIDKGFTTFIVPIREDYLTDLGIEDMNFMYAFVLETKRDQKGVNI
ncbi:conserved Plasmodium protein, unknown function [Plasmodium ovale]|uniref:RRM domain-containing protein n=1 Tax=Plasmodium ovale TaxID=36330 RepID=A0A1D3KXN5_PLAOA|nr:conserved Plasmodium protein, unknown function [Plasmodium ovale]